MSLVTRLGVDGVRVFSHQVRFDELTYTLTGVGIGDLVDLIGVEPDLRKEKEVKDETKRNKRKEVRDYSNTVNFYGTISSK